MFKIKDICRFLILTVIFSINVSAVSAQTWDMQRLKSIKRVKAEVLGVYESQKMLNLKVVSNESTGEYKQGWCYVDSSTRLTGYGRQIQLFDLASCDIVNVGGIIYTNSRKSCRIVELIKSKNRRPSPVRKQNYTNRNNSRTQSTTKVSTSSVLVK